MKHRFEYFFYLLFSQFARIVGIKRVNALGSFVGALFFYLIPIRKAVVLSNLKSAFPDKNKDEINKIALENYKSFAITFLEIALFYYLEKEDLINITDFSQLEKNKEKLKPQENGTILLTAHFGNWELGALAFGIWLDTPISVLAKKQKNRFVAERVKAVREKFGNKEVLLGASIRELYKTLKQQGYIGMVGDQRAPKDSIRVNYFGKQTPVFPGTAALALKLKPPIFVVLLKRLPAGSYIIEIKEIDYNNLPDESEAAEIELTQRYMSVLEEYVRENPAQWFWMHNIWKYNFN